VLLAPPTGLEATIWIWKLSHCSQRSVLALVKDNLYWLALLNLAVIVFFSWCFWVIFTVRILRFLIGVVKDSILLGNTAPCRGNRFLIFWRRCGPLKHEELISQSCSISSQSNRILTFFYSFRCSSYRANTVWLMEEKQFHWLCHIQKW
jgi:hypothetical protein